MRAVCTVLCSSGFLSGSGQTHPPFTNSYTLAGSSHLIAELIFLDFKELQGLRRGILPEPLSLLGLQLRNSQKHSGQWALKCQSVRRLQRPPQEEPVPSPNTTRVPGVRVATSGAVMACSLENPRLTMDTEHAAVGACRLPNNRQVKERVWPPRGQGHAE